jgi:hypothetical protein
MSKQNDGGVFISGGTITAGALAIGSGATVVQPPSSPSSSPSNPVMQRDASPQRAIRHSVFLSYRRLDAKAYAGRLRDALRPCMHPPAELFMDVDSIGGGDDFVVAIDQALTASRVVIVLIGPSWLTLAADGKPRLADAQDSVRHEVQAGLEKGLKVIPVLVDGAQMPHERQLPEPLAPLARRNAVELSDTRWDYDVDTLLHSIVDA